MSRGSCFLLYGNIVCVVYKNLIYLYHGYIGSVVKCTSQARPGSGETANYPQVLVCMYLLMVFIMIFIFKDFFLPATWVKIGTGLSVKHEINNLVWPKDFPLKYAD